MAEHIYDVVQSGQRLDKFLSEQLSDLSRSQVQRYIHEGRVRVNGADAKPSQKLAEGQRVTLELPPLAQPILAAETIAIPILYEDADVVVVDKPAGMVVHPGHGVSSGTLVNALVARYPEMRAFEDSVRPGIVHRLDKDTSGVMVVAKHPAALQHLQQQFAARTTKKVYWALVHGSLHSDRGTIEASIGRSRLQPTQMAVAGKADRAARTAFKVLER
ncbi:MAG: RluA family pseudouridine synthase, partial [Chloroflexi bacterium]|nr:RluA family pseudouridine synthase [Chloroflexota bacterium]